MAIEDDDLDLASEADEAQPAKKGGLLKWVIIGVAALVIISAVTFGTLYFLGVFDAEEMAQTAEEAAPAAASKAKGSAKDAKAAKLPDEVFYFSLEPAFVVNFKDENALRFLQVGMQVMTYEESALEQLEKHLPALRNSMVLLLGNQTYDNLSTLEGKEKLRAEALAEIQKVLSSRIGNPTVKEVYFTSFVVQ